MCMEGREEGRKEREQSNLPFLLLLLPPCVLTKRNELNEKVAEIERRRRRKGREGRKMARISSLISSLEEKNIGEGRGRKGGRDKRLPSSLDCCCDFFGSLTTWEERRRGSNHQ